MTPQKPESNNKHGRSPTNHHPGRSHQLIQIVKMHNVSMNPQRKHNKIAEHKTSTTKSIDLQIQYHDPLAVGTESNRSQQLQYPSPRTNPQYHKRVFVTQPQQHRSATPTHQSIRSPRRTCGRGLQAPIARARAEEGPDAAAQAGHLEAGEIRRPRPQAAAPPTVARRHPHAAGVVDRRQPPIAAPRSDATAARYSAAYHPSS